LVAIQLPVLKTSWTPERDRRWARRIEITENETGKRQLSAFLWHHRLETCPPQMRVTRTNCVGWAIRVNSPTTTSSLTADATLRHKHRRLDEAGGSGWHSDQSTLTASGRREVRFGEAQPTSNCCLGLCRSLKPFEPQWERDQSQGGSRLSVQRFHGRLCGTIESSAARDRPLDPRMLRCTYQIRPATGSFNQVG
jgi:hypothetical protein